MKKIEIENIRNCNECPYLRYGSNPYTVIYYCGLKDSKRRREIIATEDKAGPPLDEISRPKWCEIKSLYMAIKYCAQCPYCALNAYIDDDNNRVFYYRCDHRDGDRVIENRFRISNWCPLPEEK